jgi:hypothetical protein
MKKIVSGLSIVSLWLMLTGCEKSNCQTRLTGLWSMYQHPAYTSPAIVDSVLFYKGDSVYRRYRLGSADTMTRRYYTSYFISEDCQSINFTTTFDLGAAPTGQYDIIYTDDHRFDLRSHNSAGCDSCIISLRK